MSQTTRAEPVHRQGGLLLRAGLLQDGAVQFEVMTSAQIETIMRATQSKEITALADHSTSKARKTHPSVLPNRPWNQKSLRML